MRQSLRLGRIAGIPIGVNWTVGVILLLIAEVLGASVLPAAGAGLPVVAYWSVAAAGAVIFAVSLLVHEFSHAVVARRNGVPVRSITLWMLGGVAELDGDPPNPGADLRIAIAGPASSFALGVVFAGLAIGAAFLGGPVIIIVALQWLALMNGILAVFNLLPGAPMDGGRVLRALLWRHYRDRLRAAVAATKAGQVIGFILIAAGIAELIGLRSLGGLWLMLIGWFLIIAARAEAEATVAGSALSGLRVAEVMSPDPQIAPSWNTVQDFIDRVMAHSRQNVYPVVEFDGRLSGVVISRMLARLQAAQRQGLRVGQVATAVPPEYMAAPDDPATKLAGRPPLGGELVAIVRDHDRVVGVVTMADLEFVMRRARLRSDEPADAEYPADGQRPARGEHSSDGERTTDGEHAPEGEHEPDAPPTRRTAGV